MGEPWELKGTQFGLPFLDFWISEDIAARSGSLPSPSFLTPAASHTPPEPPCPSGREERPSSLTLKGVASRDVRFLCHEKFLHALSIFPKRKIAFLSPALRDGALSGHLDHPEGALEDAQPPRSSPEDQYRRGPLGI